MTSDKIVQYRDRINDLLDRHRKVNEAAGYLCDLVIPVPVALMTFSAAMAAENETMSFRNYDDVEVPFLEGDVKLFTSDVLWVILWGIGDDFIHARNIVHGVNNIRKSSSQTRKAYANVGAPSLDGWEPDEIEAILSRHRRIIGGLAEKLRDCHTQWKYLNKTHAPVPACFKSSVTGLFGMPDMTLPDTYGPGDFARSKYREGAGVDVMVENERGALKQRKDLRPTITSRKFWAPITGVEVATAIAEAFETIRATAAPLPGEPDTIDYFGSHVSNAITVG